MANVSNIRPFIQKWEGGLSRNAIDTASAHPAPWPHNGVTGWHTNKGVTYGTFASLAPKLGYTITPENFFAMPDHVWDSIYKNGYWDTWYLDKMNSQAIADLIADFSWGSGANGSFQSIRKYLATKNIIVDSRLTAVEALNRLALVNEKQIFLELVQWREKFFRSLSTFSTFGKGWLNRLTALKEHGLETIDKKKNKTIVIVLVLAVVVFCIYKYYYKPNK